MGSYTKIGKARWVLASAGALVALGAAAGSSGDHAARSAMVALAAVVAALGLTWWSTSSAVLVLKVQPHQWRSSSGAYEYVIKPRRAGGRSHVKVTMPLPGGGEEEVLADVLTTTTGEITIRAGSPERVTVYVD